jgi:hypothetical protein
MAKYKHYDYKQSLMIALSLEDHLMPGTLEFAIHTLVGRRLDMSVFDDIRSIEVWGDKPH